MNLTGRQPSALRILASMPFLDRLELAFVADWPDRTAYHAVGGLIESGLVDTVPHATDLTAHTRRCYVTAAGLRHLAEADGVMLDDLLRSHPVSAHFRRILLERLDAVGAIYRLAANVAVAAGIRSFRWYRAMPMDACLVLSNDHTVAVVRQGVTAGRTPFAKRLWRLQQGPLPGALLVIVPDAVSLRHTGALLRGAAAPSFIAIESDAARSNAGAPVWHRPSISGAVDLNAALDRARPNGALPAEVRRVRAFPPRDLGTVKPGANTSRHLLPTLLRPVEKRVLDILADWPWITATDLCGLLGVTPPRVSFLLDRLERLALVTRIVVAGRRRLALSDRGLTLLARRDRTSVGSALKRWSVTTRHAGADVTWRNVSGSRSRQLLRNIEHTDAVTLFVSALSGQARALGWKVVQIDPPRRASRYFRHLGRIRSIHPDAFGVVGNGSTTRPFFLEWERRAVHPSTMRARLAPYLRYYSSFRPVDDHGAEPLVLIVFDDELAEARFLGVARKELARSGVDLPLWVSHRRALEAFGPLGPVWRSPDVLVPSCAFGRV